MNLMLKILLIPTLWFCGFLAFIYTLPVEPQDPSRRTQAIVVWTGGPCRVATSMELLSQGLSDLLFVSGISGQNPQLIVKKCKSHLSEDDIRGLRPQIFLGPAALTTLGNAVETAQWIQRHNNIQSVRFVTTAMHLPRSLIEFKRHMPKIEVIPHPVPLWQFDHRDWYKNFSVFKKCFIEFHKYIIVLVGIHPDWRDNLIETEGIVEEISHGNR